MKLLFDQNLPPRLVGQLNDIFPGSSHVYVLGLERALDAEVWEYSRDQDFAIVTRDADFAEHYAGIPAESDLDQARELHNEGY